MVQDYAEALKASKNIPVPEPLQDHNNLDYTVIVLINESTNTPMPFPDANYGYLLKLVMNSHSYVAVDSTDNSTQTKRVFTLSEIRERRRFLTWFEYEGPIPPPGWLIFK